MQSAAATETNRRPIQSLVLFSLPQIQPMSMAGLFHFVLFRGFVYLFTVLVAAVAKELMQRIYKSVAIQFAHVDTFTALFSI